MSVQQTRERDQVADPLVVGRIVGDVVDPFESRSTLRVLYSNRLVANGAGFKPSAVSNRPKVRVAGGGDFRTFHTLILVDPDFPNPSNPAARDYLHWMVANIPGSTDATFGQEVVPYEAPVPSVGIHRLVFVLFRQAERMRAPAAPEHRENFSPRAFAERHGLGPPAAVVFYNCQRESGTGGRRFT